MRKGLSALFWILLVWVVLIRTGDRVWEAQVTEVPRNRELIRHKALELIEDLVQRERFYFRRTGAYTPIIARLGFEVPSELRSSIQVQVVESGRDRLLVRAYVDSGDPDSRDGFPQVDQIFANESFEMEANFPINGRKLAAISPWPQLPELEIEQISRPGGAFPQKSIPQRAQENAGTGASSSVLRAVAGSPGK